MAGVSSVHWRFLFDPLYHWAFLLALLGIFLFFSRSKAWKVFFILLAYYFVVLFTPLSVWMMAPLEEKYAVQKLAPPPAQAHVVVLTGGTLRYHRGQENFYWYRGADRFLEPLRRFQGSEGWFLITGAHMNPRLSGDFLSETESMAKFALDNGLRPDRLLLEKKARTTRQNAYFASNLLREKGVNEIYLVTSAYHMWRAVRSFEAHGLVVKPWPVDFQLHESKSGKFVGPRIHQRVEIFRIALHEYLGLAYYWVLDLFEQTEKTN